MSVIGCIVIHQCDLCKTIATCKVGPEQDQFQQEWHDGISISLCPKCKDTVLAKELLDEDLAMSKAIAVGRSRFDEAKEEYAH